MRRKGAPAGRRSWTEYSGRTVDDAIERGLADLGLDRAGVEIEVLDEGSRGVLGLRSREAKIRLRPRDRGGMAPAVTVQGVAQELISLMGFEAAVEASEGVDGVRVAAEGTDLAALIGKHGQTLAALEAIVAMIAGRRLGTPMRIELDVMGYRQRRRATLEALARRTAQRVVRSGRESALSPMDARDRRIIHLVLQDHPGVTTASRGEGELRRVVVMPRGETEGNRGTTDTEAGPRRAVADKGRAPAAGTNEVGRSAAANRQDRRTTGRTGRWTVGGRSGRASDRSPLSGRGSPARGPGRKPPGVGGAARGRPEGLPSDEELEAEIQAHLEKTARRPSGGDRAPEPDRGAKPTSGAEDPPEGGG